MILWCKPPSQQADRGTRDSRDMLNSLQRERMIDTYNVIERPLYDLWDRAEMMERIELGFSPFVLCIEGYDLCQRERERVKRDLLVCKDIYFVF